MLRPALLAQFWRSPHSRLADACRLPPGSFSPPLSPLGLALSNLGGVVLGWGTPAGALGA